MKPPPQSWDRLVRAARAARDEREVAAPHGFSARVVALAVRTSSGAAASFDRLALRAFGVAFALAVASAVINYQVWRETDAGVDEVTIADPLSVLLDS